MIVAIGCDHAGFILKPAVEDFFRGKAEILDCGIFSEARADYPDVALEVAGAVSERAAEVGVLMCGTGIGMAVSANKVKGIRAGVCNDPDTARLGKNHNDLNVLCLGGRVISPEAAEPVLSAWWEAPFEGGRHLARINKISAAESSVLFTGKNRVTVFNHPLIQHKMSIVRDKNTSVKEFRELVQEIAGLMVYEITKKLPLSEIRVETPVGPAKGYALTGKKLAVVPVLRAGLGMADGILQLIPNAKVGHVGLYRDPISLVPVEYYCKLPDDIDSRDIFVLDPMLATGGSAAEAISLIKARGGRKISLVCLIATPGGVEKVHALHPQVDIFAAALDGSLNNHGYIVPGLGDAGDRLFGTK